MLGKFFSSEATDLSLGANDREGVFRELVALVPDLNEGGRAGLLLSLLGRERLGSTCLGRGIALPHTRYVVPGVAKPLIAFGRHNAGIEYGGGDGVPVKLFFLLVSPDVSQHLQILSRLTRLLRDAQLRDELLAAPTPQDLLRSIREAEQRLHSPATPISA